MTVLEVTDSSFHREVIQSSSTVLVDFWAPWCGPCRMIAPVVDEIADEYEYQDNLKVVKINTDENPSTGTEYGIRSIPTLMIFNDGEKIDTIVGAVPKSTLASILQKHLNNKTK